MKPDAPVTDRSSLAMVAARVRAIAEAYRERDEDVLRSELRALSHESGLLAVQLGRILGAGTFAARQRIAVERSPVKR